MPEPVVDGDLYETVRAAVKDRLARNERLRRNLPDGGRLRVDRQLPFLCLYRTPPNQEDEGTRELVTSEAAYLVTGPNPADEAAISRLCLSIGRMMREHFGLFLLIEIWSKQDDSSTFTAAPRIRIIAPEADAISGTIETLKTSLAGIQVGHRFADVNVEIRSSIVPPGRLPLAVHLAEEIPGCVCIGLEVEPIYRHVQSGTLFPLVLRQLRRQLAFAIRKTVAAFSGTGSETRKHYESFGPTTMVKAVREVDQQLGDVAASFDFLLQVTPVNSEEAWESFQASQFEQVPELFYRPLPYDPSLLKRQLFAVPMERIEDPTLTHLFGQKETELDRQISALRDIETSAFLQTSVQLYGGVEPSLLQLAQQILARCPEEPGENSIDGDWLNAEAVASGAREEIDFYRQQSPAFAPVVEMRKDISAGMMVSRDKLLISPHLTVPRSRLAPLLHHEVGTHLLTYFNGRQQPFRQLSYGLAGYEALQEGLAVLSEYLAGGLTRSRLRVLAGRVIAVWSILQNADFMETYRWLHHEHGLNPRTSFVTTLRVHRAGGLTKDAVYLRGLQQLLNYLGEGHDIEPLYVGKIALDQVPFIQELRRRNIILPPALLPRFCEESQLSERLEGCRGKTVLQLLEETS